MPAAVDRGEIQMSGVSEARKQRARMFILGYPFALIFFAFVLNLFAFGVQPAKIGLPSAGVLTAFIVCAALLLANHTWLMTATELTRVRFGLHATPEEWEASANAPEQVPQIGWQELERHHNAHRNATENSVYFVLLAAIFSLVSPPLAACWVWVAGFAVGRCGHSWCYLAGRDGLRGLFMSVSLLSLYGLATYLITAMMMTF